MATLTSVLIVPAGAHAAPLRDAVSGIAVRMDGLPAANAIVTLVTDGTTAPAETVGGTLADSMGQFSVLVPPTDSLVEIATRSGNTLSMHLSIESIADTGRAAALYSYAGRVTAELVDNAFVVVNQLAPYVLQTVDDSTIDLAPSTNVYVDSSEDDSVHIQYVLTPQLGMANVLGLGAAPVTGPYRHPIVIAPDATRLGAGLVDDVQNRSSIVDDPAAAAADATASSIAEGSCDPNGAGSATLKSYKPMHLGPDPQDHSQQTDYTVIRYQRNKAHFRVDSLEYTWQLMLCGFGGTQAMNGWRLLQAGMAVATFLPSKKSLNIKVGQSWDNENNDKSADTSLGFKVDAGPVNIDVKIPTKSGGTLEGSYGVDGPQDDNTTKTSRTNTVHAWWQAHWGPLTPTWARGSRDFESVVDEALYEMGETSQPTVGSMFSIFGEVHCTSNKPCPLYN